MAKWNVMHNARVMMDVETGALGIKCGGEEIIQVAEAVGKNYFDIVLSGSSVDGYTLESYPEYDEIKALYDKCGEQLYCRMMLGLEPDESDYDIARLTKYNAGEFSFTGQSARFICTDYYQYAEVI